MVINNYKGGQLANRIISFAHLIVNSIEYNYELINPEFEEYCEFFEATSKNDFGPYPISTTILKNHFSDRLFSKTFRLWADVSNKLFTATPFYTLYRIFKSHDKNFAAFDLNDPQFIKDATSKRVITEGWGFRDNINFTKHQDLLRKFFTPVKFYRNAVHTVINKARSRADTVIGVHIRRGDYARFQGGIYFYSNEVYAEKMMQVHQQFLAEGKRCVFLICSNEQLDLKDFPSELLIEFEQRHFITDLYSLAASDAIMGPPSTFSSWASFYGKVPLAIINSADDKIEFGAYVNRC